MDINGDTKSYCYIEINIYKGSPVNSCWKTVGARRSSFWSEFDFGKFRSFFEELGQKNLGLKWRAFIARFQSHHLRFPRDLESNRSSSQSDASLEVLLLFYFNLCGHFPIRVS